MDEIELSVKNAISSVKKNITTTDKFELAVEAIINDISNRNGIKNAWIHLDTEKQDEIKKVWKKILKRAIIPNPLKGIEGFRRSTKKYNGRFR